MVGKKKIAEVELLIVGFRNPDDIALCTPTFSKVTSPPGPVGIAVSILHAFRFLMHRAPENFFATPEGVLLGLKGETGQPNWHRLPL